MPPLNSSIRFVEGTDDVHCDVYSKRALVAAIRCVQPGAATIITLHRESGGVTRYIFNWRNWRRPHNASRKQSDKEVQERTLRRAAVRASQLPKECFQ